MQAGSLSKVFVFLVFVEVLIHARHRHYWKHALQVFAFLYGFWFPRGMGPHFCKQMLGPQAGRKTANFQAQLHKYRWAKNNDRTMFFAAILETCLSFVVVLFHQNSFTRSLGMRELCNDFCGGSWTCEKNRCFVTVNQSFVENCMMVVRLPP